MVEVPQEIHIGGTPSGCGFFCGLFNAKYFVVQMLEGNDVDQGNQSLASSELSNERCLQRMREFNELIGCSQGPAIVSSLNDPMC